LSYTYDLLGHTLSGSESDGTLPVATDAFSYDPAGDLLTATAITAGLWSGVTLNEGYDAAGNRTRLAVTAGEQADFLNTYQYDANNRLLSVAQQGQTDGRYVAPKLVNFQYNLAGQTTSIDRYNNLDGTADHLVDHTQLHYDGAGRLTSLLDYSQSGSSDPVESLSYGYDQADWVRTVTNTVHASENVTYSYDGKGQLLGAAYGTSGDPQPDEAYHYDAAGNRSSVNVGGAGGTTSAYSTDPASNRLLNDGAYAYTYDNEGNRLTRTSIADGTYTEYGWDNRNRLISVTTYASAAKTTKVSQVTYTYDAFDRRVSKSVDADGSGTIDRHEFYAYDGGNVILDYAEVDGAEGATQQELKRYLDGPAVDQILAEEDLTQPTSAAARVLWHLLDNQGTARDLVDNSGALVEHYVYDAYGQLLSVTDQNGDLVEAPRSRYLYTGRELDLDTGLEYYRGRWYDPAVGRFLSEDPIRFAGGDANLYRYVGNGPTNATDPSGWCEEPQEFAEFAQKQRAMFLENGERVFDAMGVILRSRYATEYGIDPSDRAALWEVFQREFEASLPQQYELYLAQLEARMQSAAQPRWTLRASEGSVDRAIADARAANELRAARQADMALPMRLLDNLLSPDSPVNIDILAGMMAPASGMRPATRGTRTLACARPTRNSHLAGGIHPKTGIPFDAQGYPDFSGVAIKTVQIKQTGTYAGDFAAANEAAGLRRTPEGYTWHHHQDATTMQLVPTPVHVQTGHTGGFSPNPLVAHSS
ncbi:MAG: RHS repeat-associated core domain-containing protein, partial [Singulisphaera sp.]